MQNKHEWEERALWEVLQIMRKEAEERIKDLGPDSYMPNADFERLKEILDEAKAVIEQEFSDKVKKSKRGIAMFNDPSIKLPPRFKPVFMEIYDHHQLRPHADDDVKAKIKAAGGRPYLHKGYGKDDYGDLVVEPDKKVIASKLGCGERTVKRQINLMVEAGILKELRTVPNKPGMYVIGTLGKAPGGIHKRKPFIQRGDLKEGIKKALQNL
ncbi:hypothetical protein [uncultured Pseudodesulfovibrio sp.]|uniref:hypothetical protein n=1 Tax=uncultured Pseudodesulfovibrio sp. TaxID=2035858 RepID=UPI0029C94ED1|nr:hypothetical protein [uncultured Pseudodesulfovibrio sp.]